MTPEIRIAELPDGDPQVREAAAALLAAAFDDSLRYDAARLQAELTPAPPPFYRKFFCAWQDGELVGAGGIKAADWASNTHVLYLSAVARHARGQGIAKSLIGARLDWVRARFAAGCVLVSTTHRKRFAGLGFRLARVDREGGRYLMVLEFPGEY